VAAIAVAAILVPPLAALAVVGTLEWSDASGEADARRDGLQELLGPSMTVASSVAVEQAWQTVRVAGLDDALGDVPGPETVRRTDEAIAGARRADLSGEAGALAAATDAVTGLDDLRAEADAALAAAPDGDLGRATTIEAEYTGILEAYVEGVGRAIDGLDDPDLRLGAGLAWAANEQAAAVARVGRDVLLSGITTESPSIATPDEVAELAAALAQLQTVDAELGSAPDPYAGVVADADPTSAVADILAQGEAALVPWPPARSTSGRSSTTR
jgi:hypothetical protein